MIISPVAGMQCEANRRCAYGRGAAHEPVPRAWAVKDTASCKEVVSTLHVRDLHSIRDTAKRADQWEVIRLIVPVISGVVLAAGVLLATPQSSQSGSYHHLSDRGRELAGGIVQDADDYNRLTVSQRATFEAVVHALEQEGIDGLIVSVTAVWGADGSRDGTCQFRVSVVLVKDVEGILNDNGYNVERRGHVILPTGEQQKDNSDVDSARQPVRPPKLQISWLEADPTIGEVDIDYRPFEILVDGINFVFPFIQIPGGHFDPDNSNVMARRFGSSHYSRHLARYGPGLFPWWD